MKYCSKCGNALDYEDHYCAICGTKVINNDSEDKYKEMEDLFEDIFENADPEDDTTAIILMNIVRELKEMHQKLDNMEEKINDLSNSLFGEYNRYNMSSNGILSEITSNLEDIEYKVNDVLDVGEDISTIKDKVEEMSNSLLGSFNSYYGSDGILSDLEHKIDEKLEDMSSIKESIEEMSNSLLGQYDSYHSSDGVLSDIESKLSDIEGKLDDIEYKIN